MLDARMNGGFRSRDHCDCRDQQRVGSEQRRSPKQAICGALGFAGRVSVSSYCLSPVGPQAPSAAPRQNLLRVRGFPSGLSGLPTRREDQGHQGESPWLGDGIRI